MTDRRAALSAAASAIDRELAQAPVDDHFALVLRACAHGGSAALGALCEIVGDPSRPVDEAPALALVEAVSEQTAAARAVRAAAWAMTAQRIVGTWPGTWFDVLVVAREALPLDAPSWDRVRQLATLALTASGMPDAGDREGLYFQFSRESLEHVIGAATRRHPMRRDMLLVIPYWRTCFVTGIAACDERLEELEQLGSAPRR